MTCYLPVILLYIEAVLRVSTNVPRSHFPGCIEELALHINALELFVLVMAVKIWAPKLAGSRFQISCDNDAAVQVVRSGRTRDGFMQRCLRQLWLTSARYDLDLHVSHIPGSTMSLPIVLVAGMPILRFKESFMNCLLRVTSVFTCYPLTARI